MTTPVSQAIIDALRTLTPEQVAALGPDACSSIFFGAAQCIEELTLTAEAGYTLALLLEAKQAQDRGQMQ
jgi:hypothetical protein